MRRFSIVLAAVGLLTLTACDDPEQARAISGSFLKGFSNGLNRPSTTVRCTTISRKGFSETTCRRR